MPKWDACKLLALLIWNLDGNASLNEEIPKVKLLQWIQSKKTVAKCEQVMQVSCLKNELFQVDNNNIMLEGNMNNT